MTRRSFPPYQQRRVVDDWQTVSSLNKGHGRIEYRELTSSTLIVDHLDWPGAKQVCRVIRKTTRRGETTTETAYAITSVSRNHSEPDTLLEWWRGHWGIENKIHWVRDETFGEDSCRVRTGHAPQILAAVRNSAINWLRSCKVTQFAAELRRNSWNSQRLFAKLGKSKL